MSERLKELILNAAVYVSMAVIMVAILYTIGEICINWGHLLWNNSI